MHHLRKVLAALVVGVSSVLFAGNAFAEDWPFIGGDYWEITGIDIADGGSWKYANWLATEWRKDSEFAKSKGWIKDYMVISNVHNRADEPDLWLIRVREDVPSGAEGEKRLQEYLDWQTKSIETMVGESGNRAEYRTVKSTVLTQVLNFRN